MVEKERSIPRIILILQALLRRLSPQHPKRTVISEELGKRMAGFKGEEALDFILSFLEPKNYFILNDLRIPHKHTFFQIDTLLMTTKFILIIEVKYLAGTAFFDPIFNQLIQTKDGMETALPDPTLQIKRQKKQLEEWLGKNGFPTIPILSCVVMSNDRTIIRTSSENKTLHKVVINRHTLLEKLEDIDKIILNESISPKQLKKVIRIMKKQHRDLQPEVMERYNLKKGEIIKGVRCRFCHNHSLKKIHGSWICRGCNKQDRDAHIGALKDYELLIGPTINNAELRWFLEVDSPYVAKRLLQSLNLPTTGTGKGTRYILSINKNTPKQKTRQT
ncbi:NERD domain-containing protein [Bacillus sp. NTK074B]|uniref:nuclease-related domain-containing protein n=1 Tax=Bacillus sp. NTK074B TaxID=2802174 RepID=UPI001A8C7E24|nr:NERD domain-containing protein [Bacillus sp. NTK074B]